MTSPAGSISENKEGEYTMQYIDGKLYQTVDGKPVARVTLTTVKKELFEAQKSLYFERLQNDKKSGELTKKRTELLEERAELRKKDKFLQEEKLRLELIKNKLNEERTIAPDSKESPSSKKEDGKEATHEKSDLTKEIEKNQTDLDKINDEISAYNNSFKDYENRGEVFLADVEQFKKDKESLIERMSKNEEECEDYKNSRTHFIRMNYNKFNVILIEPNKMLMSLSAYKTLAPKTGIIERISWIDKCLVDGDKVMLFKKVRCLASNIFDTFSKKHSETIDTKELEAFIAQSEKETRKLHAELNESCILC